MTHATYSQTKYIAAPTHGGDEVLLSPNGVCAVLKVNRRTLDSMTPQPPFFLLGKRKYIKVSALRAWLNSKQKAAILAA
jgi:sulfur transfer complex TusBCD TusB component (DsrH family)